MQQFAPFRRWLDRKIQTAGSRLNPDWVLVRAALDRPDGVEAFRAESPAIEERVYREWMDHELKFDREETWGPDSGAPGVVRFYRVPFPIERKIPVPSKAPYLVKEIPLKQVRATQSVVSDRGIRHYLNGPLTTTVDAELPLVIRTPEGTFQIGDGHHRVVSAKLQGEQFVLARVVTPEPETGAGKSETESRPTSLYRYGLRNRPPGPGATPKGYVKYETHPEFRHGVLSYAEPLTDEDVYRYELVRIAEPIDLVRLVDNIVAKLVEHGAVDEMLTMSEEDPTYFAQAMGQMADEFSVHIEGGRDALAPLIVAKLRGVDGSTHSAAALAVEAVTEGVTGEDDELSTRLDRELAAVIRLPYDDPRRAQAYEAATLYLQQLIRDGAEDHPELAETPMRLVYELSDELTSTPALKVRLLDGYWQQEKFARDAYKRVAARAKRGVAVKLRAKYGADYDAVWSELQAAKRARAEAVKAEQHYERTDPGFRVIGGIGKIQFGRATAERRIREAQKKLDAMEAGTAARSNVPAKAEPG